MEDIEETHRMIQQMEELLVSTPDDVELLQALSDLYDLLNKQLSQANAIQQSEKEEELEELYEIDLDTIQEEMLSRGKKVIYRSQEDNDELWKTGEITNQLDGPEGSQWEVRGLEGYVTVGLKDVRPLQYRKKVDTETENSDNESNTELSSDASIVEEDHDDNFDIVPKHWGSWEAHSTGFASRMMSKMGYVPGQGLGVSGQGRLDPVEAKSNVNRKLRQSNSSTNRPGLGLISKKQPKKEKLNKKKTVEKEEEEVNMFGFMNTLLSNEQPKKPEKSSLSSSSTALPNTDREANRSLAKLQSKIKSTQLAYNSAVAAVRRNKGKPMERQFQEKLENIANSLSDLKREANTINRHVNRKRERESMHTF